MKMAEAAQFAPSLWDQMLAAPELSLVQRGAQQLTLEQYKRAIARDLEDLLNTRLGFTDDFLSGYPFCMNSIVNFGLADFAHMCLTDSQDRKDICDRLQAAIERHEPRLTNVRAHLVAEAGVINRPNFVISGRLRAITSSDRVQFDLTLEPSSLRYFIR